MALNDISMPEPRHYSQQDLNPCERDPRCGPQFPLGTFWPVYVSNFWCEYSEHATRMQEYFATKGLLVRMVFGRSKGDPHFNYQRSVHMYDFLVYFVRKQDADDAVSFCHRDMYYGHRLNVFPGREPVYFDETKTVKVTLNDYYSGATEQVLEELILEKTRVAELGCVVKNAKLVVYVELLDTKDSQALVQYGKIRHVHIEQLVGQIQKQRFLEPDVEQELATLCTDDPNFLQMAPPDFVLQALFESRVPDLGRRLPNRQGSVRYPKPHLNDEQYRENKEDERRYQQDHYCSDFENPLGEFVEELKNCNPDEEYAELVRRRRLAILAKGK